MKKIFILSFILLFSINSFSAVTFESAGGASVASGKSISWTQDSTSGDIITAAIGMNSGAYLTGFSYAGTNYGNSSFIKYLESGTHKTYFWTFITSNTGPKNITITVSGNAEISGVSSAYSGAVTIITPIPTFNAIARSSTVAASTVFNNSLLVGYSRMGTYGAGAATPVIPSGNVRDVRFSGGTYSSSIMVGDLSASTPGTYNFITHWNRVDTILAGVVELAMATPTATPTITKTATPTRTATPTITRTATSTVTPTVTVTPMPNNSININKPWGGIKRWIFNWRRGGR